MVFFTCNNCGDSLKKKDCANHAGKCHPLALTCVDCHKDFYGDQYVAHTSCITEAEKYGAKGFVSKAPSTAGAAKQEEWVRAVHLASKEPGLSTIQKSFLEILTRHGNVPRKKKQFQNFAKSVWRESYRQAATVEQVFSMIESELKKIKGPPKETGPPVDVDETPENVAEKMPTDPVAEDTSNVELVGKDAITSKKSKKHKKNKEKELDELVLNEPEEITGEISSNKKSKKHKGQPENEKVIKENGNGTESGLLLENAEEIASSKKSKKKKHKKQEDEAIEEAKENGYVKEEAPTSKKIKKENKKLLEEAEVAEQNGLGVEGKKIESVDDLSNSKKSKKKKHKKQIEEEVEQKMASTNGLEELAEETSKKSKKKKHRRQDDQEEVPRKKSKLASA